MVLLAAFQAALSRWSGRTDIVVGSPVAGRAHEHAAGVAGNLLNSIALRSNVSQRARFTDLLEQVRRTVLNGLSNQDIPLEAVMHELIPDRSLSHHSLFQVMFVLKNYSVTRYTWKDVVLEPMNVPHITSQFDLILSFLEMPQGLHGEIEYATDLFDAETIQRMASHLVRLLEGIAENPTACVSELPFLSELERSQLLIEWNRTEMEYPRDKCLHQLFADRAERTPHSVALVSDMEELTYGDLERRSNQLAHYIRGRGVRPGEVVGLCTHRSALSVLGLLGILRAGGAYLPIDPDIPSQRLNFMLESSGVRLILSDGHLAIKKSDTQILLLPETEQAIASQPLEPVDSGVHPTDLAYVIYTSGSTGIPKGVAVEHRALVNHMSWLQEVFPLLPSDRMLQKTALSFDASLTELLWPICNGAQLVLTRHRGEQDPEYLMSELRKRGITVLQLVPSLLRALVNDRRLKDCVSLHRVICAGEVLPREICNQLQDCLPGVKLHNLYGPTEAAIDVSAWPCETDAGEGPIPIGRPIWNTQLYVLDAQLAPVPVGVVGELYIAGDGLARGYLGKPGLTAERFIGNPFGSPGSRLYHTGDLARWHAEGYLEYIGRSDQQVKIRGFRIELGEIETALLQHPSVYEAAVLARQEDPGTQRLVAYLVSRAEERPNFTELRNYLKSRVPEYMVAAIYVWLEALPLTPSGKVDRTALAVPEATRPELEQPYEAPRTAIEAKLARIWSEILNIGRIGIHDNFFELGGDSIQSLQIVARANGEGLALTVRQMFGHQTIAELAAVVTVAGTASAEQAPPQGDVPLTPIQRWFFENHLPQPNHYNQAFLVRSKTRLVVERVSAALHSLVMHHDALRLRFRRSDLGWQQWHAPLDQQELVERLDLSNLPQSKRQETLRQTAQRIQVGFDLEEGPLLRAALFDYGPELPQKLLLIAHHLVIDGVSWRILFEDFRTAYEQIGRGEEVRLPAKTASFKSWAEQLCSYADSERSQADWVYWSGLAYESSGRLPRDYLGEVNSAASRNVVRVVLTKEDTLRLQQDVPGAFRTQVHEVLLTALAEAISEWTGSRVIAVTLEGHGREVLVEHHDVSRTVGWFTSIFPVLLDIRNSNNYGASLISIKEQLRAVPNRGVSYGILRYLRRENRLPGATQPEVSFNYLGKDILQDPLFEPIIEDIGETRSESGPRREVIEIDALIQDGSLIVNWGYSSAVHKTDTITALADNYLRKLRAIIEFCTSTKLSFSPSDFSLSGRDGLDISQRDLDKVVAAVGGPTQISDIYPLSALQEGIVFHSLLEPGSQAYVTTLCWKLLGEIEVDAFTRAWQYLVDRHPVFRTAFVSEATGIPLQVVLLRVKAEIQHHDLRRASADEQHAHIETLIEETPGFVLHRAPLMRLQLVRTTDREWRFIWSHHHVILDGWSVPTVFGELTEVYAAFVRGEKPRLRAAYPYREYIAWLKGIDQEDDRTYWHGRLADFDEPTPLGIDSVVGDSFGSGNQPAARCLTFDVPRGELERFLRCHQITASTLMHGLWAIVLSRYSGHDRVVFGTTVSGRPAQLPGIESRVGIFINTVPCVVTVPSAEKTVTWLGRLHKEQLELLEHQHTPLLVIQACSAVPQGTPLFSSLVLFQNFPAEQMFGENKIAVLESEHAVERSHYPLVLQFSLRDALFLNVIYDTRRFESKAIERLMGHLQRVLEQVVALPDTPLRGLTMLSDAERRQLIPESHDAIPRPVAAPMLSDQEHT